MASQNATPRLTCESCQARKVKCDKAMPCASCQRLKIPCVPVERHRLARGKSKAALQRGRDKSTLQQHHPPIASTAAQNPERSSRHDLASGSASVQVVQRLETPAAGCQIIGFGHRPAELSSPNVEEFFTVEIRQKLCLVYLQRVDPVFKILHWPSLHECLVDQKPYLDYDRESPAVEALSAAVYYAAVSSLTDSQSVSLLDISKAVAIKHCQANCEMALEKADLIITEDLTVLQAFILFLVASRLHDRSRRVWTLLALVLRISQALSLHLESPPFPVRPFEQEMRRRVWFAVCLLDVQSALDQSTEAMVPAVWLQSHGPTNINDIDLRFDYSGELKASEDFTDTTFTLMICTAQFAIRFLNASPKEEPGTLVWEERQNRVNSFRERSSTLLRGCSSTGNQFHWYTINVAEYLSAAMQLVALRPLRNLPKTGAPHVKSGSVLRLSVDILQKSQTLLNDPRGHLWYWFDGVFFEWHALAVAISEICALKEKHLVKIYWPLVEYAVGNFNLLIANSKVEKLWKPIKDLIRRTRYYLNHDLKDAVSFKDGRVVEGASSGAIPPQSIEEPLPSEAILDPAGSLNGYMGITDSVHPIFTTDATSLDEFHELTTLLEADPDPISDSAWAVWEQFVNHSPNMPDEISDWISASD
ncbi:hypothetical protein BP6252_09551 [Coleophoma cylindrospora]|uniref:Zn(2)-C6 fungal-type domain-containing protein n=1 Tax=Coleophoma cylindrospora TaxID=1849047 RepID=A0A3D8R275_9HELO|nr:hypothetical protein BP6252_09551 [Coleophoma cylindrospora]